MMPTITLTIKDIGISFKLYCEGNEDTVTIWSPDNDITFETDCEDGYIKIICEISEKDLHRKLIGG